MTATPPECSRCGEAEATLFKLRRKLVRLKRKIDFPRCPWCFQPRVCLERCETCGAGRNVAAPVRGFTMAEIEGAHRAAKTP